MVSIYIFPKKELSSCPNTNTFPIFIKKWCFPTLTFIPFFCSVGFPHLYSILNIHAILCVCVYAFIIRKTLVRPKRIQN